MDTSSALAETFLTFSKKHLVREMWPRLCACLSGLTEEQIWWRPNEASNSIGNLLLHLNGNVRQWLLQGLGRAPNSRDRNAEFAERSTIPLAELRSSLESTLQDAERLLEGLTDSDLLRKHDIQVYRDVSAMDAIYHVVEHFSMHYGQILYISKMVKGEDLGFYAHLSA